MADSLPDVAVLLHAWRQRGSRRGSVRGHHIEALAARAAQLQGHARDLLDARLRLLIQAELPPQDDTGAATVPPIRDDASAVDQPLAAAVDDLPALVRRLSGPPGGRRDATPCASDAGPAAGDGAANAMPVEHAASPAPAPDEAGFPALPALDAIRLTWARLRNASQLQHIMAEVPEDAGPLHSTVLVHRAIALMHDTAPGYLQHFLGYADALAGLERISPTPANAPALRSPRSPRPPRPASPANAPAPGKRPRPRPRGRRRPA